MKISAFLFCFFLLSILTQAQINQDSLWGVWNDELAPDTSRAQAMYSIARDGYLYSQPDSAFYYAQLQYDFASSKGLKKDMADALNIHGITYFMKGEYDQALDYYQRSLKLREEVSDKKGITGALINIGMIHSNRSDYPKAMEYFQRSLKIAEEISDKKLIANILGSIGKVFKYLGDYTLALDNYNQSYEIRKEISDKQGMANMLNNMGSIYMNQGLYPRAIDYYQQSLNIREDISEVRGVAAVLNNIGLIYLRKNDYSSALIYFRRSLEAKEKLSDKNGLAITLNNIGTIYMKLGYYPRALDQYRQSLKIREEVSDKRGIAESLNNIGEVYMNEGDYTKALDYFQQSLTKNEEISDKRIMVNTLNNLGKINNMQGNYNQAITWCKKSLLIAEEMQIMEEQKNACQCLYSAYKSLGDNNKALFYFERIVRLNDSLQSKETAVKLQQLEFAIVVVEDSLLKENEKIQVQLAHDTEVRKKNKIRNLILTIALFLLVFAIGIYRRIVYVRKAKRLIEKEKDRSDNLLLNILPSEIAEELKEKGRADAKSFEKVAILFTDFKSFTEISEILSAEELVGEINTCFKAFDAICNSYGIEKIKTIGDAYMAAGGLPVPTDNSVKNTILAGLEMAEFITNRKKTKENEGNNSFEMRVGIHTGRVVAGIVGVTKFQYDIWGDAVNIASRMESSGEVGKVNISQSTYELIKADPAFKFQSRGKVKAKGKGDIQMWFVEKVSDNE